MIKLGVTGAAGRMGKAILNLASQDKAFKITAALELEDSPAIGTDVGALIGTKALGVKVTSDTLQAFKSCDVVIDFTHASATSSNLAAAKKTKTQFVLGTTGFDEKVKKFLKSASKSIGIVQAPNMSIGVNLLFKLAEITGKALDEDYDIEIVEAHHRMKKDAPSGTALGLLESVAASRKKNIKKDAIYGRVGETGARPRGELAVHTMRGGDVVGDHTVFFLGNGERIELTHKASSRDAFASGALKAAKFIVRKRAGLYNMRQVLGID